MGLFKVFKKKEVPAQLPGLSINEVRREPMAPISTPPSSPAKTNSIRNHIPANPRINNNPSYKPLPVNNSGNQTHHNSNMNQTDQVEEEKGFFRDLMQELTSDIDKTKLDEWDKNQFLTEDIVNQMKGYWEKQKPEFLLRSVGGDLKKRLKEKTEILGNLEKEWQDLYLSLTTKEDKIREEEKELKSLISELTSLYETSVQNKKKNTSD